MVILLRNLAQHVSSLNIRSSFHESIHICGKLTQENLAVEISHVITWLLRPRILLGGQPQGCGLARPGWMVASIDAGAREFLFLVLEDFMYCK
jgi:hypothetical protein